MIRSLFFTGKWLFIGVVSVLLLLFLSLGFLLYNPIGLHLVVWGAEKALPELTVGKAEGVLGHTFSLHDVSYRDPASQMTVTLQQVSLALDGQCFFQPALCVDSLSIDGVKVKGTALTKSPREKSAPQPIRHSIFVFPIPVKVTRMMLNHVQLELPQGTVHWETFSTGFSIQRNRVQIGETHWQTIDVTLPKTETSAHRPAISSSIAQDMVLPEIWIPVDIRLAAFHISAITLHQPKKEARHIAQINISASAYQHQVRLKKLDVSAPEIDIQGSGEVQLTQGYPLNAHLSSSLKLPPMAGQTLAAYASGSLDKLSVHLVLGGKVAGNITGNIDARLSPRSARFPFQIAVSHLSGQWPLTDPAYLFTLNQLSLTGDSETYQINSDGKVWGRAIPETQFHVAGQGNKEQLTLSDFDLETLNGHISGQSEINWQKGISIQSDIALQHIEPQIQWPTYPGQIDGTFHASASFSEPNWSVSLSQLQITGQLKQYPLNIAGALNASYDGDHNNTGHQHAIYDGLVVDVPLLTISHGPNHLEVKGKLDQQWQMDIGVSFPDLSKSVTSLLGQIQGAVHLRGKVKHPDIALNLTGKAIQWQHELQLRRVDIQGHVSPSPTLRGKVKIQVQDGRYQQHDIQSMTLALEGGQQRHEAAFDLVSPRLSTHLQLSGSATDTWTQWRGRLEKASVTVEKNHIVLAKPTSIALDTQLQQLSIQAHCWLDQQASLCLTQPTTMQRDEGVVHLALNHFELEQLASLFPQKTLFKGHIDAETSLEWHQGKAPQIRTKIVSSSGLVERMMTHPVRVHWQRIQLNASLKEHQVTVSGDVNLQDNGDLKFNLTVPNMTKAKPLVTGTLAVHQIDLNFLQALIGEFSKFHTVVNSHVSFSGPFDHPKVKGHLALNEMNIQGEMTPVDIRQGEVVVQFNGYQASGNAQVETPGGVLNLKANADWASIKNWKVGAHLYADGVTVNVPPMAHLTAVPDLMLIMTPSLAKVEGSVSLPKGRIVVETLPSDAIRVSKDQVIVDSSHQLVKKEPLPIQLETNVIVKLGDQVHLSAFGLKGRLQGQLKVTQRDQAPFINGDVNIFDGTYRSFGQDLVIQQGKILMNGPVNQPYVSITAIRNPDNIQDNVTAGIKVTGSADHPSVSIFSDPVMPQANALSYLLRGQNLDAESGGNAITSSLIGLSLAQSGKVVGEIGQAFGVQDLQLDTSGAGDGSQVTVSGYILPGLQIKYGVGIFNSIGEFTVRYRLMKDLYIEAISGLTSTVDLLYQFNFD